MQVDLKKMKMISVVWGLVLFLIVIGLTVFGIIYKNQAKEYQEFEWLLSEKAKEYLEKKGINFEENFKISLEELKEEQLIDNALVRDNVCDGYVITEYQKSREVYHSYIHCGKYKTRGYK